MELDQQLPELESEQVSGQLTAKRRERTPRLMLLFNASSSESVYERRNFWTAKQFRKRLTEPSCILQLDLKHLHGCGDHHLAGTCSTPRQHFPPQGQIPVGAIDCQEQCSCQVWPNQLMHLNIYMLKPDQSFYVLKLCVLLP